MLQSCLDLLVNGLMAVLVFDLLDHLPIGRDCGIAFPDSTAPSRPVVERPIYVYVARSQARPPANRSQQSIPPLLSRPHPARIEQSVSLLAFYDLAAQS